MTSNGRTLIVDPNITDETETKFKSLETAIGFAEQSDTIRLVDGHHNVNSPLIIDKSISIEGESGKKSILHFPAIISKVKPGLPPSRIAFLDLYFTETEGITVQTGRCDIVNCTFYYRTLSSCIYAEKKTIAHITNNQFTELKNSGIGEFSKCSLIYIIGTATITNNTLRCGTLWCRGIDVSGNATIANNTISSAEIGVLVHGDSVIEIRENTLLSCGHAINVETCDQFKIVSNTILSCVIGINIHQVASTDEGQLITNNTIERTIGPAICIPRIVPLPVIADNKLRVGKTIGIRCAYPIEESSNKFRDYPLGNMITNNKLDMMLAALEVLGLDKSLSGSDLGEALTHTSFGMRSSKLIKSLKAFPDLFVINDDDVDLAPTALAWLAKDQEEKAKSKRPVSEVVAEMAQRQVTVNSSAFASSGTALRTAMRNVPDVCMLLLENCTYDSITEDNQIWIDKSWFIQGQQFSEIVTGELITDAEVLVLKNLRIIADTIIVTQGHTEIMDCVLKVSELRVEVGATAKIANCTFIPESTIAEQGMIHVQGIADLVDNTINGKVVTCSAAPAIAFSSQGSGMVAGNKIDRVPVAISILTDSSVEIKNNTITTCFCGIQIYGTQLDVVCTRNKIWNTVLGIHAAILGTNPSTKVNITYNIIKHTTGPGVAVFSEKDVVTIKKNEISDGLTIPIRIPPLKKYERIQKDNKVGEYPFYQQNGQLSIGRPLLDLVVITLTGIASRGVVTASYLGPVLKAEPYKLQISKVCKMLQQFDLFSISQESISFSERVTQYMKEAIGKEGIELCFRSNSVDFSSLENSTQGSEDANTSNDNSVSSAVQLQSMEVEKEAKKVVSEQQVVKVEQPQKKHTHLETHHQVEEPTEGFEVVSRKKSAEKTKSSSAPNKATAPSASLVAKPQIESPAKTTKPPQTRVNSAPTPADSPKPKRQDWSKHARKIFDRTGGLCYLCRKPMKFENRQKGQEGAWHIEHVMPFSKYPELDNLANLLPAHIDCDSCKGASHLQSIINESDFDLLTLNISSLHPQVAQELRAAKELYRIQVSKQPKLLKADQFGVVPQAPAQVVDNAISAEPKIAADKPVEKSTREPSKKQFELSDKVVIPFSELKISDERLGEGSFSTVWKAKYNGTPVAVKKIHDFSTEYTKEFQREVGILSNLRHPNIILMMGVCLPPDPCVIVTELFEKRSLQHVLDSKEPILDKQKVMFALDIARGMCYLHKIKILHLDLKPLNVMVDNSGTCKIADFGLSKALSLSSTGNHYATNQGLIGTMLYMSPEMLAESPTVDFKADVYSFGVILWQIFTRVPPYQKMTALAIMREVAEKKTRPKIPPNCWYSYGALMSKCWDHDPVDRPMFETVVEVLEELLQLIQESKQE